MKKALWILALAGLTAFGQWSLILLPDTQYDPGTTFDNATRWISAHRDSLNIKFVQHLGDITENGTLSQFDSADASMSILDGVVPYCLAVGNHDYGGSDYWGNFRQTFPVSRYGALPTWGGTFMPGKLENAYHLFSADGTDYLIITLEFLPRDPQLAWADSIVRTFPDRQIIFATHQYMNEDDTRCTDIRYAGQNSGEDMWNEFVRKHKNFFLVVSGHVEGRGAGRRVDQGDSGNYVYQTLSNIQSLTYGSYYLRIMTFYPSANRITVKSFSPDLDRFWGNDAYALSPHTFDIDLAAHAFVAPQRMPPLAAEDHSARAREPAITAFPNPFNTGTALSVSGCPGSTELKIFDVHGRLVKTLNGNRAVLNGEALTTGVYFATLRSEKKTFTRRLFLLK